MTITKFSYETVNGITDYVSVDNGNGTAEVMTEAEYERRQAEQSTPNLS
jgi:hypothetical protein